MTKIIYIPLFILCFFSCKYQAQSNLSSQKVSSLSNVSIVENEVYIKEKKTECISDILLEEAIPTFSFDNTYKNITFLIDTLFSDFHISHIKPIKNSNRNYLEMSKNYAPSVSIKTSKTKENIYRFFIGLNSINIESVDTALLEYAEINFSTLQYKNINREFFKIKKDTSIIDIGITKQEFANIFKKDVKQLCDTIFVGNETEESYYIFNDNKLKKVIFNFYTP